MPRRPRSWLPDGFFHVGSKGTGGVLVFADDADREAFLRLLEQAARLFGVRLLAWCLMSTHYHLVVEASCKQLTAMMHRLNGLYAQRFNRRHGRKGHLFEERFWSWVIDDEEHLSAAVRYVLGNPPKAGLCVDWRDWPWSWTRFAPRPGTVPGARLKATWPPELRGWKQDDVDLARSVDADGELLLDVGTPTRAGDDRQRARQIRPERREQLVKPRQDPVLGQHRHVHVREQRPTARLVRCRRQHDRSRVREPVQRRRDARPFDVRAGPAVDVAADSLGVRDELLDERNACGVPTLPRTDLGSCAVGFVLGVVSHRRSRYRRPSLGSARTRAHARPGPTSPASG